jgi:hypothetical protein
MSGSRVSDALLAVAGVLGVLAVWTVTLVATLYMAVFHLPLSALQSVVLVARAPAKRSLRTVQPALLVWFIVMTLNQSIALGWLLGYAVIKDRVYSTAFGDTISALYFTPSAFASVVVIYALRHQLWELLS